MEVLCERCHTEYDFDDALVSERGTTVKCTTCGHQFKIHRPRDLPAAPERWLVRARSGQEFVYTSLRDLQRAIARGQVGRDDTLVREGLEPRALSSIAELDPFFPQIRVSAPPRLASEPPRGRQVTPKGMGLGVASLFRDSEEMPTRRNISAHPPPAAPEEEPPMVEEEATVPRLEHADFLSPQAPSRTEPPPKVAPATSVSASSATKPIEPSSGAAPTLPLPKPAELPAPIVIRQADDPTLTPTPSDVRVSYSGDDLTGPHFVPATPKRSSAMRWIVAVVVLGGLAVIGASVGRGYMFRGVQQPSASAVGDSRVADLLRRGERDLFEGDLEGAKENFDKASVLADNDARVMVWSARLANIRAEQSWLRLRLLPSDSSEALASAKRELDERCVRAQQAADRAALALPGDVDAIRARIDAYRLSGDLPLARRLVSQVTQRASEPETAYVLAALEMSEAQPNWLTVIERLRNAVGADQNLGRARAALVYALASAGQLDSAAVELEALSKLPRHPPLLGDLKAFLARRGSDAGAPATSASADGRTMPVAGATGSEPTAAELGGSSQDLLRRARDAQRSGDLARAETLFRAALAKNPQDTEALGGLGDIAKARGDKGASVRYYEEVAKQNPGYLPALIGMADAKWESGDRAGAVALYRQVLDRVDGQGPYADKARQRISASPSGGNTASTPSSRPAASGEAPRDAKPTAPAGVDTSDLPGWKP